MFPLAMVLFFIGTVLLCLDINIEGFGPPAATGVGLFIISAILTILASPVFGVYIVFGMVVFLIAAAYVFYKFFCKSKLKKRIILEETLTEDKDDKAMLSAYVGKSGIAKTSLRPCGFVTFGNEDVEAYSDGPYIYENTAVVAVKFFERKLFVRKE